MVDILSGAVGKRIEIYVMADSMRVGKTTAVKVIAEGLRRRGYEVTESYEDWQHNPYLKGSYSDPARNFLESQKWFARRKYQQIVGGMGSPLRSKSYGGARQVFIQDVAPEMDYNYAVTNRRLSRMSAEHFAEYEAFYKALDWGRVPAPTLLVYLQVSDEGLIKRALDSAREFETVEPEYFLMMKRVNREWLEQVGETRRVLTIDTDELDFAHDDEAKIALTSMVIEQIN